MMNLGIELLASNLLMSFETIVFFVMVFAGIIFFSRGFVHGTIFYFFTSGCIFLWFYSQGWEWQMFMVWCLINLVLMTLTLYVMSKVNRSPYGGGFV